MDASQMCSEEHSKLILGKCSERCRAWNGWTQMLGFCKPRWPQASEREHQGQNPGLLMSRPRGLHHRQDPPSSLPFNESLWVMTYQPNSTGLDGKQAIFKFSTPENHLLSTHLLFCCTAKRSLFVYPITVPF